MCDRTRSLALVALLLISTLAGVVPTTAVADGAPSGMVALDDTSISEEVPNGESLPVAAADFEGGKVLASDHAETLSLTLTTASHADEVMGTDSARLAGDGMALVLSDETNHAGREVAVEATVLRNALGYLPETVEGVHDDSEPWTRSVQYRDGYVVFEVPEFSSNTVTFGGEVEIRGSPATDGTSYRYDLSDMDSASAPNLTLTGHDATEWDNVSASGLGNGDSLAINPAGHRIEGPNSSEPEVVLTGNLQTTARSPSGSVSPGGSDSISVDGNQDPQNPTLTVTGSGSSTANPAYGSYAYWEEAIASGRSAELTHTSAPETISAIKAYWDTDGDSATVDIYVVEEDADGTYQEGTQVASGVTISGSSGTKTVDIDDYRVSNPGGTVTIEIVTQSTTGPISLQTDGGSSGTFYSEDGETFDRAIKFELVSSPSDVTVSTNDGASASFGDLLPGETKTRSLAVSTSSSSLDFSAFDSGSVEWNLEFTERTRTETPKIDLDGDSINEVSHSGMLSDGETVRYQVPGLSPGDDSATVSTAGGSSVGVEVKLREVSESRDIGMQLNGNWQNHSSLADGETANYSLSESWLANGTNRINVSVAPGLSADAPAPSVGVEYRHDARDDRSVAYAGEAWSERYNVSRTWGDANQNATLEVPFAGNVVQSRGLRVFINGTETVPTWSRFQNTTLEVGLGDLAPRTETRVVANGSKVRVEHGTIRVLDPTTEGNDLDSKVEVTSRDANESLNIAYGGTVDGDRVHYAMNESWSGADEVHRATAAGDRELRLDAPDGGTFRVGALPVETVPQSGDVEVQVSEPRSEEPQFYVQPGDSTGDTVKFRYLNANADTEYLLYSESNGVVRDSGMANSLVTLTDDDSEERLVFRLDGSGGTSDPPTDDWPRGFPTAPGQFAKETSGGNFPLVLLVSGLGIAVLWYARTRYRGASGVAGLAGRALSSNVVLGALVVAVVGVGAAVGGVSLPPGAGLLLLVTGVPLATYLGLRRTGQYSHVAFGAVTVVALVLGLQLLGGDVVGQVLGNLGPSMPIFAIGGLYVAYKGIEAYRAGKTVNLSVRGFRRGSNDDGGP